MRLFVAVWPPSEVVEVLDALSRPDDEAVRWTGSEQWHVTLRFLGEVEACELPDVSALAARRVEVGPATKRLGRSALVAPVSDLDDLAAAVGAERFTGHLTLARARGRRGVVPRSLAGQAVAASWVVDEVTLVRSHLGGGPARYEIVDRRPLGEARALIRHLQVVA